MHIAVSIAFEEAKRDNLWCCAGKTDKNKRMCKIQSGLIWNAWSDGFIGNPGISSIWGYTNTIQEIQLCATRPAGGTSEKR